LYLRRSFITIVYVFLVPSGFSKHKVRFISFGAQFSGHISLSKYAIPDFHKTV